MTKIFLALGFAILTSCVTTCAQQGSNFAMIGAFVTLRVRAALAPRNEK
jgi:hypothetical protein